MPILIHKELRFRKLGNLQVFITTGCNIPIFLCGLPRNRKKSIRPPNSKFVWQNYSDEDDVLGWPLQELSDSYKVLVQDIRVDAGGIFRSWNPFSHWQYWEDVDVLNPIAGHLSELLGFN